MTRDIDPGIHALANSLLNTGEYDGMLTNTQVKLLLGEIFQIVIPRIAGSDAKEFSVEMDANIEAAILFVRSTVQIISPIPIPFSVRYALGNDTTSTSRLRLVEPVRVDAGLAQFLFQLKGIPTAVRKVVENPSTLVLSCLGELLKIEQSTLRNTSVDLHLLEKELALKLHMERV